MMSLSRTCFVLALAVAAASCGGGGGTSVTGPTPSTVTPPQVVTGPPQGASLWTFGYRTASAHTCPAVPQTPDDGGVVTLTLATDGRTLTLVGLAATAITVGTVNGDGAGGWSAQRTGQVPGSLITLAFRFTNATHAEGTIVAANAIFTGGIPCSATWPIVLDRQG